ncbi:MAG: DinB family protein [Acidimicrobiales bacterium]
MDLAPATASGYARLAFDQMLAVADRLSDATVNERPLGPDTNAVAAIVIHCCGVGEFWLGHVGLGRESQRDREAEFERTASVAELHALVDAATRQIDADLDALEALEAESPYAAGRQFLTVGDQSDASLVLHVIEELFQHLGHCELAADALVGESD